LAAQGASPPAASTPAASMARLAIFMSTLPFARV
jgi:hypothetical protein